MLRFHVNKIERSIGCLTLTISTAWPRFPRSSRYRQRIACHAVPITHLFSEFLRALLVAFNMGVKGATEHLPKLEVHSNQP